MEFKIVAASVLVEGVARGGEKHPTSGGLESQSSERDRIRGSTCVSLFVREMRALT